MSDHSWRFRGACRHHDPELWFQEGDRAAREEAQRICGTCPVQRECVDFAFRVDAIEGIFGGLTQQTRTAIIGEPAEKRRRQVTVLNPCGTEAAYKRHLRRRETPCEPCTRAARRNESQRRIDRQERRTG